MTDLPIKRDRRIERTRQLLSKALMDLIVERGYESITIQDITDRADVSRTTFYLHFKDKDELLFASMSKIYDGLVSGHEGWKPAAVREADFGSFSCDAGDFEHVAEYADFYRIMLSKNGSLTFMLRVMSYLSEVIMPTLNARLDGAEPQIPLDMIAAFLSGAQVGVTKWWIENDLEYSSEEVATMQFFLSMFGLKWALGKEKAADSS